MDATTLTESDVLTAIAALPAVGDVNPAALCLEYRTGQRWSRVYKLETGVIVVWSSGRDDLHTDATNAAWIVFRHLGIQPRVPPQAVSAVEASPVADELPEAVQTVLLVEGNPCAIVSASTDELELAPVTNPVTGKTSSNHVRARRDADAWYLDGWLSVHELEISGPVLTITTDRSIEYVPALS